MQAVIGDVASLTARILAVGAFVDAGEILARPQDYVDSGAYSWKLIRTRYRWLTVGVAASVFDVIYAAAAFRFLMAIQIATAMILLIGQWSALNGYLVGALFLLRCLIHLRHQYGLDGSDQMTIILLATLTMYYIAPSSEAQGVAIGFIAFQSGLAYVTSGVAKAVSPTWRSGRALMGILNTQSYGSRLATSLLHRNPWLSFVGCWAVIIFEIAFPLALLSEKLCAAMLALGILFHLGVAYNMGLNNFLWSFTATYPAVLHASRYLHRGPVR